MRYGTACLLALAVCAPLLAQENGQIDRWLICGAFQGLGGIAARGDRAEAYLRPAEGDTVSLHILDSPVKAAWRPLLPAQARVNLETEETFKDHPSFAWPWGCAYACAYLSAPEAASARLRLRTGYRLMAWWDEEPVTDGTEVRLGPEPSRLLVKILAPRQSEPQYGQEWWFEARVVDEQGKPVQGLRVETSDPERAVSELAPGGKATLGRCLKMTVLPAKPRCTFVPGERVQVALQVSALSQAEIEQAFGTPAPTLTSADGLELKLRAVDYDGEEIASLSAPMADPLASPQTAPCDLGDLPLGFYTILPTLHSGEGAVLRRFEPVGVAMVRGPVGESEYPRKLASAFYWMTSADWQSYIPWLARVGLTRNLGACASWWTEGYKPDTEVYRPEFDQLLELAGQERVEIIGYLDGGWPAKMNPKLKLTPKQLFVWMWQPLPEWDSDEYERILRSYVRNTVLKYRDRIRVWKSYNELDLTPMSPETYVHVARIMSEEIRRADPEATFVGASFCKPPDSLFAPVAKLGGLPYHDAVDIHCYPLHATQFGSDIDLWDKGGVDAFSRVLAEYGADLPFWWGEVGARRAYPVDGARGQCDFLLRMAAIGMATPKVELLAWCDPYAAHTDDFALARPDGSAMPVVCAQNAAAHFIDGKRFAGTLDLKGMQAGKFVGGGQQSVVLWGRDEALLKVTPDAQLFDHIGRKAPLSIVDGLAKTPNDGRVWFVTASGIEAAR